MGHQGDVFVPECLGLDIKARDRVFSQQSVYTDCCLITIGIYRLLFINNRLNRWFTGTDGRDTAFPSSNNRLNRWHFETGICLHGNLCRTKTYTWRTTLLWNVPNHMIPYNSESLNPPPPSDALIDCIMHSTSSKIGWCRWHQMATRATLFHLNVGRVPYHRDINTNIDIYYVVYERM